jgi:DNA-directed RNA polymerase specialized sigma24 family protein
MSQSFDIANDKFTRGIIRRKSIQISQRLGFSEQDLESLEQTMLTKVIKAMPSFNPDIAHRNVFITTVVERHAARLIAERSFPKNGPGHVQSLNATVVVPGDLPTELQYTLDDSIGGARLQVERKAANELNDLVSDVAIAISRLPEPWQRMLELRKTHSMVQVSELMGMPRSTLRHWMGQIADQFEAEGLREYIA